jgi:CBS domain-containing protein
MKPVRDIVVAREPFSVTQDESVLDVCRVMTEKNVGAICVVHNNRLVGVFSERDLLQRVVVKGLDPARTKVQDVMTTQIVFARADEDLRVCLERMQQAKVRHLPVVEGDRLLGMLSMRDLMQQELDSLGYEVQVLTEYVYQRPPI